MGREEGLCWACELCGDMWMSPMPQKHCGRGRSQKTHCLWVTCLCWSWSPLMSSTNAVLAPYSVERWRNLRNLEDMLPHWKGGNIHHQEERNNPERRPRVVNGVNGKMNEALSPGTARPLVGSAPGYWVGGWTLRKKCAMKLAGGNLETSLLGG